MLVSSGGRRYFSFMPLTSEAIQRINWIVEDLWGIEQRSEIEEISYHIFFPHVTVLLQLSPEKPQRLCILCGLGLKVGVNI